jgi:hypothetical protein
VFHAVQVADGKEVYTTSATAYTGASVSIVDRVAYFGTFDNQVIALDLAKRAVNDYGTDRKFRTLVVGGRRRPGRARRPRSDGARARRDDWQTEVGAHDARADRLVARDCRITRLCREQ